MGFTIRCKQCGVEVELHETDSINRIGRNEEKIFSHSNGIACDCGNKVYNNLSKEFDFLKRQSDPRTEEELGRLNQLYYHYYHSNRDEAEWAQGCLSKAYGIIDSSFTVMELLPIATSPEPEGYDPLVALSKASYSYNNMLSLFHDLLDNIGFMYSKRVLGSNVNNKNEVLSFYQLFALGELKQSSNDQNLDSSLQTIYNEAKKYVNLDNHFKHRFSPRLVLEGRTNYAAIPAGLAYKDAKKIKDNLLYLALICALQLIYYKKVKVE